MTKHYTNQCSEPSKKDPYWKVMTHTAKIHHKWYVIITWAFTGLRWTRQSRTRSENHCSFIMTGDFNQTACRFDVSLFLSCCQYSQIPWKTWWIPFPPQKRVSSSNRRSFLRPNPDIIIIKGWWSLNVWNRETQLDWVCSPKTSVCVCVCDRCGLALYTELY